MLVVFAMTLMAQNPFLTKADMVEHFNISPNGERIVYRELTSDGFSQVSFKNLKTGEITLVSCLDIMGSHGMKEYFSGADFLSDNVVIFCKDGYLVSFDVNKNKSKQLFKLPDCGIFSIKASNDGKGVYCIGFDRVYYASIKKGIVAQTDKVDGTIVSLAVDKYNRAFYTTVAGKVYCFDGLNKEKDVTSEMSKFVADPYLIETTRHDNCFIVRGVKEGVFKVDLSAGKSVKLMDYKKESPLYVMRLSPDGNVLYYNTLYEKRVVRKLNLSANQVSDADVNDDVVMDIAAERKLAPYSHTEDGVYYKVDEVAEFPGGKIAMLDFIDGHLKHPGNGKRDRVEVIAVVDTDGTVRDAKVSVGTNEEINKEVLRVVKLMPKWKPAKVKGKEVPMFCSIPFVIRTNKPIYVSLQVPEVEFFRFLYKDDFIGDTLVVNDKTYYFSQSSMKQFDNYMWGKEDHRLVLVQGDPKKIIHTYGMPDKGYVLHFSTDKEGNASVDKATYNGSIYREENGKPFWTGHIASLTRCKEVEGRVPATWLNGRYRLNDVQVTPGYPYRGRRYIAVFEHGKLIEILPDKEKESYNPPLVDISESPEGMPVPEYVPEYVYYKLPNGEYQKEKFEVTKRKWQPKVLDTFKTEPFLDRDCVEALKEIWIKK